MLVSISSGIRQQTQQYRSLLMQRKREIEGLIYRHQSGKMALIERVAWSRDGCRVNIVYCWIGEDGVSWTIPEEQFNKEFMLYEHQRDT
jgi:hypothetical protein